MLVNKDILKNVRNYFSNRDGHIAVITGLLGLPLIMGAGYALDYNNAYSKKNGISSALDSAVLAAVLPANLDNKQRAQYAHQIFNENYFGDVPVKLSVNAERERVDIKARAEVPSLFGGIVNKSIIGVEETAAAVLTTADVVCVLALDPTGSRAIEFLENARFSSPECSVQVNSTNPLAMNSEIVTAPIAKSFCVGGISRGKFDPFVKHACTQIVDPYQSLDRSAFDGAPGVCVDPTAFLTTPQLIQMVGVTEDIIGDNAVLPPGNYCNGLRLAGVNIQFLSGTYNISGGNLHFESFASVKGNGVTFVLNGGESSLTIESGASATFVAPSIGDYAGLVFYQTRAAGSTTSSYPDGLSTIGSGGSLNITGTAYFPTQELIITSDAPVASQAPATSFIAYRLKFSGESITNVNVDHEAGGIPPLLPRSDDGARLVSYRDPGSTP